MRVSHRSAYSATVMLVSTIGWTDWRESRTRSKAVHGEVRRAELAARCGVSHEVARRALASLAGLGLLRRVGLGRATRDVSRSFWLTFVNDAVELMMTRI